VGCLGHIVKSVKLTKSSTTPTCSSGGCGAQYAIDISSKKFNGLTQLKQHRLVNEVLKEELKQWHAIRLTTSAVKE
jgi:stress-induced morphogen